jgi:MFS family permease
MGYYGEFRSHWRPLAAASVGLTSGFTITTYVNNLFIPPIMKEFGWTSAQIAIGGMAVLVAAIGQPVTGRLADRYGVRRVACFGMVAQTVVFVGLSLMRGSFAEYLMLYVALLALSATTTTSIIYSRLVVQTFDRAMGAALAIAAAAPPLVGAMIVPLLSAYIDTSGWRPAYRLVAVCTAAGATLALLLIPPHRVAAADDTGTLLASPAALTPIGTVIRNPAFALLVGGMLLCSLTIIMQSTQLKVILLNAGLSSASASWLISLFALGVIGGLFTSGAAFDHFPAHLVAGVVLGLPGIGLAILATGTAHPVLLGAAVLLLGLSQGAEGNVANFMVARYFSLDVFSTVAGFVIGAIALSGALGSMILAVLLNETGSFTPFLVLSAVAAFVGATLFLRMKNLPVVRSTTARD